VSIAAWRLETARRDNLPEGNACMLAILAENLKLILLLFMIATIVGLSWFGNERWKR
jgi:hypothetical protein